MTTTYKPPIFIVGLPRSGSTLLELTVSKSPGVLLLAEGLYLSPWRRDFRYFLRTRVGDISNDANLRKMIEIIFSNHGGVPGLTSTLWRLRHIRAIGEEPLKEKVFQALKASDRSLGTIYQILLREITLYNGRQRCSVSFPVHVSCLPKLVEWFPEAKIIHITRDPRGIAISKTNDPGGTALYNQKYPRLKFFIRKAMIGFVIVQYISASRIHTRFRNYKNYLLVQYEDLVLDHERLLRGVCSFADAEFTNEMLEQTEERAQRSSITGEVRTKADAKAASKWKEIITPFEEFLINFLTKPSMAKFGFNHRSHPVYSNAGFPTPRPAK